MILDMLGNEISEGDIVLYPGGNARYGGLKLIVGLVIKKTPKRISLIAGSLTPDGKAFKSIAKTGAKVLRCEDPQILQSETVKLLYPCAETK
jgi:hypothetical protein